MNVIVLIPRPSELSVLRLKMFPTTTTNDNKASFPQVRAKIREKVSSRYFCPASLCFNLTVDRKFYRSSSKLTFSALLHYHSAKLHTCIT